ncbi:hypothetical protein COE67_18200 [Priestia megaterium]|nr:hypothetical protein CON45_24370 [Priestia megaterium]PEE42337.1 hypothetical protein COM71_29980 [Priestia megaterium]PFK44074.1 hypothetical protein COJ23_24040 [Priestia megaterium]PFP15946.1 hypothetical protein COJ90_02115 [Priestia megaterium]PGO54306.1 hypothetical protein CN981_20485 [Priestia megaterium]
MCLESVLWCDKKSLLYSVAHATDLDAKTIPVQNCESGNGLVGCMRKQRVSARLRTLLGEDEYGEH